MSKSPQTFSDRIGILLARAFLVVWIFSFTFGISILAGRNTDGLWEELFLLLLYGFGDQVGYEAGERLELQQLSTPKACLARRLIVHNVDAKDFTGARASAVTKSNASKEIRRDELLSLNEIDLRGEMSLTMARSATLGQGVE